MYYTHESIFYQLKLKFKIVNNLNKELVFSMKVTKIFFYITNKIFKTLNTLYFNVVIEAWVISKRVVYVKYIFSPDA